MQGGVGILWASYNDNTRENVYIKKKLSKNVIWLLSKTLFKQSVYLNMIVNSSFSVQTRK